eukprot:CAMPEP_0173378338 /NCGR_PEP_ID=MMETSP1356-20130122/1505_1 /TAXON_ID=77927 ORGANISM="Hemiselmis virescens, Strain PCC157" /NCGR_SAMPLE_ID=MMETSP1356 /ASSEMBLY_ACC=CAM_ASM_000847 /LENGTH=222 /DNA_ID=CAMNT_0014331367 /DNA_START=82 /DNA_END=746 /DNA_ORIENTATION=-
MSWSSNLVLFVAALCLQQTESFLCGAPAPGLRRGSAPATCAMRMEEGGKVAPPVRGEERLKRRKVDTGTIVVSFGRQKQLNEVELYKFTFFQTKFDYLCKTGRAEEAMEVLLSSEANVQVSGMQAAGLLANLPAKVFMKKPSEDQVEPLANRAWKLLQNHAMWHLTSNRKAKDQVEKDIAKAEKALRSKWQILEDRHLLHEVQPFFFQGLNVTYPVAVKKEG